jgi:hypothetical protein
MRPIAYKEQSMKHMLRDSLVRMPAEVAMTMMSMFIQEQEHIFVEKNQLSLKVLRASQVSPE